MAYSYWRINITAIGSGGAPSYCTAVEIEMATSVGGSNACSGGTASASDNFSTDVAANAFDGNTGTVWAGSSATSAKWIQYQFASAVDIAEIRWRIDNSEERAPTVATVQASNDGSTWTEMGRWVTGAWAEGQTKKFFPYPVGAGKRLWRFEVTANGDGSYSQCAELVLHATVGGADIAAASAYDANSGTFGAASNAFDGNNATIWTPSAGLPGWLQCQFPSDTFVAEVLWRAGTSDLNRNPSTLTIKSSSDGGSSWTTEWTESGIGTWTSGLQRTFTNPNVPIEETLSQGTTLGDTVATEMTYGVTNTQLVAIAEPECYIGKVLTDTLTQATVLTHTQAQVQGVGVHDEPLLLTDAVQARQQLLIVLAQHTLIADVLNVSEAASIAEALSFSGVEAQYWYRYGTVVEALLIGNPAVPNTKCGQLASDAMTFAPTTPVGFPTTLTQAMTVTSALLAARGVAVLQNLGLVDTAAAPTKYGMTLLQALTVSPALQRFLGGGVVEGLSLTSAPVPVFTWGRTVAESVALADTLPAVRMVFRADVEDAVEITFAQIINQILRPTLTENVRLSAAYIAPNGGVVTWAMNTGTSAVTEYTNFDFNSFVPHRNTNLAASSSGLFLLHGDTDNGEDVVSQIRTGLMAFNGSRFTAFKAMYLSAHGGGEMYVKLRTGRYKNGVEQVYTYLVDLRTMEATRVKLGKGLSAQYFSVELISTGQDFDLDKIEFIPMLASRHI